MCDPVTATALAMSAGGTLLQTNEANKNAQRATNAKNQKYAEGMARQREYANQAGQAFNTNTQQQGRESFDTEKAKESEKMKQAFATNRTPDTDYTAGVVSSTPKNVILAREAATGKVNAQTDRDVNNLSTLSGYGGALFNQGLNNNEFARLFGNLQDTASRDSALIPLDMSQAANNSQKAPSIFPTLLKVGGTAMGMYSAANGINSFGDKVYQGPTLSGAPMATQPGLFTNLKNLPNRITGGSLY